MKFGVFCVAQAPAGLSPSEAMQSQLRQAVLAEELGFDSLWIAEHHSSDYCVVADPFVFAAAAAALTSRIRIGTAVSLLPLHNPLEIAEQAIMVDHLSGGRLDVGVGRGYVPRYFDTLGLPKDERGPIFAEALEVIVRAWTEPRLDHEGPHWRFSDISLFPRPLQTPHPPVFVASSGSPETIQIAARYGFPIMQGNDYLTPEKVSSRLSMYGVAAQEAGRSDAEIVTLRKMSLVTQKVFVGANAALVRKNVEPHLIWTHRKAAQSLPSQPARGIRSKIRRAVPAVRHLTGSMKDWDQMTYKDLARYEMYGTPDDCIRRIEALRDAGVQRIACWFSYGGLPETSASETMRLFAREVMPAFTQATVA